MLEKRLKIIYASAIGAIFSVLFVTASTIIADLYAPHKDWLKAVFSHHWIGKSVLAAVAFIAVWLVLSFFCSFREPAPAERKAKNALLALFWTTVFSIIALVAFFILHFLKVF